MDTNLVMTGFVAGGQGDSSEWLTTWERDDAALGRWVNALAAAVRRVAQVAGTFARLETARPAYA